MKKLVAVVFVLFAGLGAKAIVHAQALPTQPLDRIVAVAEGDVILQSELDRAVKNVEERFRSNPQQLPPHDVLERQVLESLIMMRLQVQRADDTGIRVGDAEVDNAVRSIAQHNNLTVDQLNASLARDGVSLADFRKNLHDQIMVQKLRQRIVEDQVHVSDSEVNILLASNSLKSGEVHLQHILISVPEGASAADIQAAHDKAEMVRKKIEGGMDFTAAAIHYSNAPDALQGGDLGWRSYDEVPEAFANLVEGMKDGDVSQVLHGPSGFHIVKLVGKRADSKQVVTEYHARDIQINVNELVSNAQAKKTIDDIRHRIVAEHEDFGSLAKQFSQDLATKNAGGDMGWFELDRYGSGVSNVLVTMKKDEVSQPFQSDAGWHLIQLLGTRQQDRTQEMKREQALNVLRNRKAEQVYDDYLRQLRDESYVEVRLPGDKSAGTDSASSS